MYLLANIKLMPLKFKFETPLEQNEDSGQEENNIQQQSIKPWSTVINIIL